MSSQYGELRSTNDWDRFTSLGHPSKFLRVSRLGSVTARHSSIGRQPNFAALNRGRHLYSAGRPSRWALVHISSSCCCDGVMSRERDNRCVYWCLWSWGCRQAVPAWPSPSCRRVQRWQWQTAVRLWLHHWLYHQQLIAAGRCITTLDYGGNVCLQRLECLQFHVVGFTSLWAKVDQFILITNYYR